MYYEFEDHFHDPRTYDYYVKCKTGGKKGCCLFCKDSRPGCVCWECKCRRCTQYIKGDRKCRISQEAKRKAAERCRHPLNFIVGNTREDWCTACGQQMYRGASKKMTNENQERLEEIMRRIPNQKGR